MASLSSGKATPTTRPGGSGPLQQALAYARCLRQRGLNLPDPQLGGNGIAQQLPTAPDSG